MNLHKLKELEESPLRENRAQYLKRVGVHPWDYEDKKCRYHRRDYGQAHKFAEKMIKKNIGKDTKELRNKLKNDPRYKHRYFFRKGIDCAIKDMLANAFYYRWYRSDYYVDKKTNVLCKREIPVRKRRAPRPRTYYEYVDGTIVMSPSIPILLSIVSDTKNEDDIPLSPLSPFRPLSPFIFP